MKPNRVAPVPNSTWASRSTGLHIQVNTAKLAGQLGVSSVTMAALLAGSRRVPKYKLDVARNLAIN
jgi:hypothetical protein